jgi:Bacterial PH domain
VHATVAQHALTVPGKLRWLHSCAMKRTLEMGEMADTSEPTAGSYAPWSMRLVGVALLVVALSVAVVSIRSDRTVGDWASLPFLGVMLTATLIFGTRFSLVPRISWDPSGVTVHNPLRINTLPWSHIDDFVAGSFALRINTTNGKHVGVWAVQRANAAKPGRSVVDLLAIKLRKVQGTCASGSAGESVSRTKLPWAEVVAVLCYLFALAFRISH